MPHLLCPHSAHETKIDYMTSQSNTLRSRQNGCHFPDNIFKHIFFKWKWLYFDENLIKFVPQGPINNILALVQIMAWCRSLVLFTAILKAGQVRYHLTWYVFWLPGSQEDLLHFLPNHQYFRLSLNHLWYLLGLLCWCFSHEDEP